MLLATILSCDHQKSFKTKRGQNTFILMYFDTIQCPPRAFNNLMSLHYFPPYSSTCPSLCWPYCSSLPSLDKDFLEVENSVFFIFVFPSSGPETGSSQVLNKYWLIKLLWIGDISYKKDLQVGSVRLGTCTNVNCHGKSWSFKQRSPDKANKCKK